MGRKLAASVYVPDGDGTQVRYEAGSEPPAAVAKQITNESAWLPADDEPVVEPPPAPAPKATRRRSGKAKEGDAGDAGSSDPSAGGQPAVVTQPDEAAHVEAWRAFAQTVGVTPEADADAAAIRADLAERGLLESA